MAPTSASPLPRRCLCTGPPSPARGRAPLTGACRTRRTPSSPRYRRTSASAATPSLRRAPPSPPPPMPDPPSPTPPYRRARLSACFASAPRPSSHSWRAGLPRGAARGGRGRAVQGVRHHVRTRGALARRHLLPVRGGEPAARQVLAAAPRGRLGVVRFAYFQYALPHPPDTYRTLVPAREGSPLACACGGDEPPAPRPARALGGRACTVCIMVRVSSLLLSCVFSSSAR